MFQWAWCAVVAVAVQHVRGCNVRELSDIIQRRFREEVAAQCRSIGDSCTFDRECCKGLECSMSASQTGVGLSCQRAWLKDPDRGDMVWETPESLPREPKSEDGDWMVVKSKEEREEDEEKHQQGSAEGESEKMYPTDMLTGIENLQTKKKQKLLRENNELEKLFTDREENELEQLRMLREDAEVDEIRRLKELRLRRKMNLIKELEELRGLKAERDLIALDKLKEAKNANKSGDLSMNNQTYTLDNNSIGNLKPSAVPTDQERPDTEAEPLEKEDKVTKHKQGIHEVHHKRKHHHHKKKDAHPNLNNTSQTEAVNEGNNEITNEFNAE